MRDDDDEGELYLYRGPGRQVGRFINENTRGSKAVYKSSDSKQQCTASSSRRTPLSVRLSVISLS